MARNLGLPNVDGLLDTIEPHQFDEWAAFERLEPSDFERFHAQLSAIGGGILYELQVLSFYVAHFVADEASRQELKPPKLPSGDGLDPLKPKLSSKKRPTTRNGKRSAKCEFVSPFVASAALNAAMGGSRGHR